MASPTPRRVVIDGVEYVPLHQTIVDPHKLIATIVDGYMGDGWWNAATTEEREEMLHTLYLQVMDDPGNGEWESLHEMLSRMNNEQRGSR